jgi:hypothetical protein
MNDDSELGGRTVWRGKNDVHDPAAWAHAIASSNAELFAQTGTVIWLDEGKRIHVNTEALRDISKRFIAFPQPMNFGTAETPNWRTAYYSAEPTDRVLRALLTARTVETGSLACLLPEVPGAPSVPSQLTPRQQDEARMRLRQGEPKDRIADYYHVDIDEIAQLGSGR